MQKKKTSNVHYCQEPVQRCVTCGPHSTARVSVEPSRAVQCCMAGGCGVERRLARVRADHTAVEGQRGADVAEVSDRAVFSAGLQLSYSPQLKTHTACFR